MLSTKTSTLLLFALLSSISLTLNIPHVTNPIVVLVGNNTLGGDLHCEPNDPSAVARPTVQHCISAVRRLSSSDIHGTFHNISRGDDPFTLPVSKSSGLCRVSVQLKGLTPDDGTWLGLNLAATQLTTACADRWGLLPKRGGWTDAGDNDRIRITVQSTRRVLDHFGGETTIGDVL